MSNVMAPISANALWPEALAAINGGGVVRAYATPAAFRAETDVIPDNTLIRILSPEREYRYSSTSGAGWADDGNTILRQTSVPLSANGRAFSTAQGAVCPTFDALRGLVGGKQDHVHLQSHTAFGDGGGGIFDRIAIYEGATDDNGTIAIAGDWVYVRRDRESEKVNARWFGINGVDDTEAFTRALAYSVGATYADWVAGAGDDTADPSHPARPVAYSGTVTLTDGIEIRFRGVQIHGPTSYGEGFVRPTDQIVIAHSGNAFTLYTGPDASTVFRPSLALIGANIKRGTAHISGAGYGIYVDGYNWFRGLVIQNSSVTHHKSSVGMSALYAAHNNQASGLVIANSSLGSNNEYGIDTATTVSWDLSDIRNSGLNHNTIGACRMLLAGGTIERIDIEGGGSGGYLIARGARVGHFYVEATGATNDTAIKIYTLDCDVQPSICSDSRPAVYWAQYCTRSRIFDRKPVRVEQASHCDIPSGWLVNNLSLASMSASSISHCCERAPYLNKLRRIPGASSYVTYADPAQHTTFRSFDGYSLPAAVVGTSETPDNAISLTVPCTITAGHAYLVAFAIQYPRTPASSYSASAITGIGQAVITESTKIPPGGSGQSVIIFCASAGASSLAVTIWPYSNAGADTGYGAAISPICVVDLGPLVSVDQMHVPSLIDGLSDSPVRAGFYAENTASVALSSNASTAVLAEAITGLAVSSQYSCVLGYRATLWADADLTKCGSIDETVCLHIATDVNGLATVTVLGAHIPDVSRLPSTLLGATSSIAASTGGVTVSVTRPTGLDCHAKCRIWIDRFERIS